MRFGRRREKNAPAQQQTPALVAASERLSEHIADIQFSDEFRSVLLSCLQTAYLILDRFRADRRDPEAEVGPDTGALLQAWRSQAPADRAIRTTTWLVLGGAMAQHWPDRRQEAIDAASAAMPLSPLDLSYAAVHFDDCFTWVQESDIEIAVARMVAGERVEPQLLFDEWSLPVILHSFEWLTASVLQVPPPDEEPALRDDSASWGLTLMEGMFDTFNDLYVWPDDESGLA